MPADAVLTMAIMVAMVMVVGGWGCGSKNGMWWWWPFVVQLFVFFVIKLMEI